MVLAEKEIKMPMEYNWEPLNKPTYMWSTNIWQRNKKYSLGKGSIFNKFCLKKTGYIHMQNNGTGPLS